MGWFGGLLDLLRTVDGLLQVERKHAAAIDDLRERIARLETERLVLVAEVKAAAASAASVAASQHVADIARRQGALEAQVHRPPKPAPSRRLPPASRTAADRLPD